MATLYNIDRTLIDIINNDEHTPFPQPHHLATYVQQLKNFSDEELYEQMKTKVLAHIIFEMKCHNKRVLIPDQGLVPYLKIKLFDDLKRSGYRIEYFGCGKDGMTWMLTW